MFEEAILKNTPEQIAKLWNPAIKAHEDPSIGVKEFTKKAAYYVIRDCAKITRQYLPIHVWELYDDPIGSLKGKFTKVDVEDFLVRSRKEPATTALKKVIVSDIKLKHKITQPTVNEDAKQAITFEEVEDDLYGYYEGYDEEEEDVTPVVSSAVSLSDDELIRKYLL